MGKNFQGSLLWTAGKFSGSEWRYWSPSYSSYHLFILSLASDPPTTCKLVGVRNKGSWWPQSRAHIKSQDNQTYKLSLLASDSSAFITQSTDNLLPPGCWPVEPGQDGHSGLTLLHRELWLQIQNKQCRDVKWEIFISKKMSPADRNCLTEITSRSTHGFYRWQHFWVAGATQNKTFTAILQRPRHLGNLPSRSSGDTGGASVAQQGD